MKLLTLVVCFSLYVGYSHAHVYEACPAGWMSFDKSCYRYFGQPLNQITAENVCRMFSGCGGGIGHLVSVNTRAENDFIFNHLKSTSGLNPPPTAWLGGKRNGQLGTWEWSDGTNIGPFSSWVNNQAPQEQGMNCMIYGENQQPLWQHINCVRNQFPYICEMRANIPVDPATCFPDVGANPGTQPAPWIYPGEKPAQWVYPGEQPGQYVFPKYEPVRMNKQGWVERRDHARA